MHTVNGDKWHYVSHERFNISGVEVTELKLHHPHNPLVVRHQYMVEGGNVIGSLAREEITLMPKGRWEVLIRQWIDAYEARDRPYNNTNMPETYGTW